LSHCSRKTRRQSIRNEGRCVSQPCRQVVTQITSAGNTSDRISTVKCNSGNLRLDYAILDDQLDLAGSGSIHQLFLTMKPVPLCFVLLGLVVCVESAPNVQVTSLTITIASGVVIGTATEVFSAPSSTATIYNYLGDPVRRTTHWNRSICTSCSTSSLELSIASNTFSASMHSAIPS